VPVYAGYFLTPDVIVAAGSTVEDWYGSGELDVGSTDPVQQIWLEKVTSYGKSTTSDPGVYTVQYNTSAGYDAAAFVCEAIRRSAITPNTPLQKARTKIRDELAKIKMKTYSSVEFRWGEGGKYEKNRLVKPVLLFQVNGGKLIGTGALPE
jgi:hypothetical protein